MDSPAQLSCSMEFIKEIGRWIPSTRRLHCRQSTLASARLSTEHKGLQAAGSLALVTVCCWFKAIGSFYLHRKVNCTAAEPAWPCLPVLPTPREHPVLYLHGKAACGGIGWKRERVGGAEMGVGWIWLRNNPPCHVVSSSITLLPWSSASHLFPSHTSTL